MKFRIDSMSCDGCVRGIAKAVKAADPDSEAVADLARKTVEIRSSQPQDVFLRALAAAGYPAEPAAAA